MRFQFGIVPTEPLQLQKFLTELFNRLGLLLAVDTQYSQAQLLDKDSAINTRGKTEGLRIWDATNKVPLWSQGKLPEDAWVTGAGTVAHSPV